MDFLEVRKNSLSDELVFWLNDLWKHHRGEATSYYVIITFLSFDKALQHNQLKKHKVLPVWWQKDKKWWTIFSNPIIHLFTKQQTTPISRILTNLLRQIWFPFQLMTSELPWSHSNTLTHLVYYGIILKQSVFCGIKSHSYLYLTEYFDLKLYYAEILHFTYFDSFFPQTKGEIFPQNTDMFIKISLSTDFVDSA